MKLLLVSAFLNQRLIGRVYGTPGGFIVVQPDRPDIHYAINQEDESAAAFSAAIGEALAACTDAVAVLEVITSRNPVDVENN